MCYRLYMAPVVQTIHIKLKEAAPPGIGDQIAHCCYNQRIAVSLDAQVSYGRQMHDAILQYKTRGSNSGQIPLLSRVLLMGTLLIVVVSSFVVECTEYRCWQQRYGVQHLTTAGVYKVTVWSVGVGCSQTTTRL